MSGLTIIDPVEFARIAGELRGEVALSGLQRLADVLVDTGGELSIAVTGRLDDQGCSRLRISIAGELHLRCQRCLGKLDFPLDMTGELKLVADALALGEIAAEAADVDEIVAPREMDVLEWLEDEVLLALPMAPRHETSRDEADARNPESCGSPDGGDRGSEASAGSFAALAGLKSRDNTDR